MNDPSTNAVNWIFSTFPSQKFKDDFGAMLFNYAKGECEWDAVVQSVKDAWAAQKTAE